MAMKGADKGASAHAESYIGEDARLPIVSGDRIARASSVCAFRYRSLTRPCVNVRKSLLIAVTAMAAIPFASEARSRSAVALDACVKAFVETHLPNYPVRQFRKDVPASNPIEAYWVLAHIQSR